MTSIRHHAAVSRRHGSDEVGPSVTQALSWTGLYHRPLVLVYGNKEWEEVIFRDELGELTRRLNLRFVHVLEKPPPGWDGETGFISPDMLERHLADADPEDWQYFVCGPERMMDIAERFLLSMGVPLRRLTSERFNIA